MTKRYLITSGNPDDVEPEIVCACRKDTLEATLRQEAERIVSEGGDVTQLHVWELTPVSVTTKAFEISHLPDDLPF